MYKKHPSVSISRNLANIKICINMFDSAIIWFKMTIEAKFAWILTEVKESNCNDEVSMMIEYQGKLARTSKHIFLYGTKFTCLYNISN